MTDTPDRGALDLNKGERRHRGRSRPTPSQVAAITAIVATGAMVAVLAIDSSPTGSAGVDALYRGAFVVMCALAGSRARRWSLVTAAGIVTLCSTERMLLVGVAAMALAIYLAWQNQRDRTVGALTGTLVALCALNLAWPSSPSGATAAVAAAAVVPMWVSGYRLSRHRTRRTVRIVVGVWLAVMALGLAGLAWFGASYADEVKTAAADSVAAASGITAGATATAAAELREAAARFDSAADASAEWWMLPARAVPIAGPNLRLVHDAARSGAALDNAAADLAGRIDYDELQLPDGGLDLALFAEYRSPLNQAAATVTAARDSLAAADSPWVLPFVKDRLSRFETDLATAESGVDLAAAAVDSLPGMLGADMPRRYLLLLGNPAEARDLGGHLGNWAEVVAEDGRLDVVRVGNPYDLYGPSSDTRPTLDDTDGLSAALLEMDPTVFPQNWAASPDMAEVAEVARQLYPQTADGAELDGVVYADPFAFAALVALTGPIQVDNSPEVTADNAVKFLTEDQFVLYPSEFDSPVDDLVRAGLDRLTSSRLAGPDGLADAMGPVVRQGRLQMVSFHDSDQALLTRTGLTEGALEVAGSDLIAVLSRNANPNKVDAFLERTIDYDVTWEPRTGAIRSRAIITLRNTAPLDLGLPDVVLQTAPGLEAGTNRTQLSVVTPLDALGATVDGTAVSLGSQDESGALRRHTILMDVPAGETRTAVFQLDGAIDAGTGYRLRWINQPLVRDDDSRLLITVDGASLLGGGSTGSLDVPTDRIVDTTIRAAG